MLQYTTYSEAGGVGKSTLAGNLAVAHARAGLDVLLVPLDPQDGDVSRLLDVDHDRTNIESDNIVRHMIGNPKGDFDELVETREGVDIIPEHNMLSDLNSLLKQKETRTEGDFDKRKQLLRVLHENNVQEKYDVLICDPPATEGAHLHNAIYATRTLLIPVEPSAKGEASIQGLQALVNGLSKNLSVEVGVIGAIPVGFKDTNDQREILDEMSYSIIETISERSSLFEGAWKQQCSAFEYVREYRERHREYELETLEKLDRVARELETRADIQPNSPPTPGAIKEVV